ncbi:MAG: cysS [Ignavibacteria bacterium]|nr:cysS [Ignavibacteria bacterium]
MKISLYNSLSKKIESFNPLLGNQVRMYSCGPTVYNYAHIGNMRAFLFADLLQRVLRVVGNYSVRWVMNITNIDDKTIKSSKIGSDLWKPEMGEQTDNPLQNLSKFTLFYEDAFIEDITKLGINPKHIESLPRATEFIPQMQDLTRRIVENGYAYISDGSVYFNVAEWRKKDVYGKLFKIDFENFRPGVRMDADQYQREDISDFVLWKVAKPNEPFWKFELSGVKCDGRPGWHLECSAMERELLGLPFDIHTGGIDLKFPHHEDEIAQSKAGYGNDPTTFWCHNEFLFVEGEKMSKSKNNFYTLRDLLDKNIDALDIRFSMLSAHYGSVFNFTFNSISSARKARMRIQEFIYSLFDDNKTGKRKYDVEKLRNDIFVELANDLHSPKALAQLFAFINTVSTGELDLNSKTKLIVLFTELNDIFSVWEIKPETKEDISLPEEVVILAQKRLEARLSKDFKLADEFRQQISSKGYSVKDTKDSFELEKL